MSQAQKRQIRTRDIRTALETLTRVSGLEVDERLLGTNAGEKLLAAQASLNAALVDIEALPPA